MEIQADLSGASREVFRRMLEEKGMLRRGGTKDLVAKLAHKCHEGSESVKVQLSKFKNGKASGLRYVFGKECRCGLVGKEMGFQSAKAFEDWFRSRILNLQDTAPEQHMFAPGFREWPAIPIGKLYKTPPVRDVITHVPALQQFSSGNDFSDDLISQISDTYSALSHRQALCVVVRGSYGQGKSCVGMYVASRLALIHADSVCFVDDWDALLQSEQRERLRKVAQDRHLFVCAVDVRWNGLDSLPQNRIIVTLDRVNDKWACEYADHLNELLSLHCEAPGETMKRWCEEHPLTSSWMQHPEHVGQLLHQFEREGKFPQTLQDLIAMRRERVFAAIERKDKALGPLARLVLFDALADLAADALGPQHTLSYDITALCTRLRRGEETEGSNDMVARLLSCLVETHVLIQRNNRVSVRDGGLVDLLCAFHIERAAVRPLDEWADASNRLLNRILVEPELYQVFALAIMNSADGEASARLLALLDELEPSVLAHSMEALTLALGQPGLKDPKPAKRLKWVLLCLDYWLRNLPSAPSMTFLAGASRPVDPTVHSGRPLGIAPLNSCARMTRTYRDVLPPRLDLDGMNEHVDQPLASLVRSVRPRGQYQQIEDGSTTQRHMLAMGAPWQHDISTLAEWWHVTDDTAIPHSDVSQWWKIIGIQRIEDDPDARDLIVGMHPLSPPLWRIIDAGRGVFLSRLEEAFKNDRQRTIKHFPNLLKHVIYNMKHLDMFRSLKRAFDGLDLMAKQTIRIEVEPHVGEPFDSWCSWPEVMVWVIQEFAPKQSREDYAMSYLASRPTSSAWEQLLEVEWVNKQRLLEEALRTASAQPAKQTQTVTLTEGVTQAPWLKPMLWTQPKPLWADAFIEHELTNVGGMRLFRAIQGALERGLLEGKRLAQAIERLKCSPALYARVLHEPYLEFASVLHRIFPEVVQSEQEVQWWDENAHTWADSSPVYSAMAYIQAARASEIDSTRDQYLSWSMDIAKKLADSDKLMYWDFLGLALSNTRWLEDDSFGCAHMNLFSDPLVDPTAWYPVSRVTHNGLPWNLSYLGLWWRLYAVVCGFDDMVRLFSTAHQQSEETTPPRFQSMTRWLTRANYLVLLKKEALRAPLVEMMAKLRFHPEFAAELIDALDPADMSTAPLYDSLLRQLVLACSEPEEFTKHVPKFRSWATRSDIETAIGWWEEVVSSMPVSLGRISACRELFQLREDSNRGQ